MRALVNKVLEMCEEITSLVGACSRCGRCCKLPFLLPEDKARICKYLGISISHLEEKYLSERNSSCPFFENNRCKIYPVRPTVCRIYPFMLLPHGLFLMDIHRCTLARKIYENFLQKKEKKKKHAIVKIPLIKLEEFYVEIKGLQQKVI